MLSLKKVFLIGNKKDLVDEKIQQNPEYKKEYEILKSEIRNFESDQNLSGVGIFSSHFISSKKYGDVYSLVFEMVKRLA